MERTAYSDYQDPMVRAGLGQYSRYRDSIHTAGSSIAKDKGCQIIDGWWENDKNEKITLSQEGSNVRMVVQTSNIEDGAEVTLTIYKSIYLGLDNEIGTFESSIKKNKASILINLIEDKVVKEDNAQEFVTGNNALIEELYFKVNITHANGTDEKILPLTEDKYLQVVKQAVLVSIFVEFPIHQTLIEKHMNSSSFGDRLDPMLQDMGLSGHSAIAIDGYYYDYGPSYSAWESPGIPWWDKQARVEDYEGDYGEKDLEGIRELMKSGYLGEESQSITETQVLVTKLQAKKIKDWWNNKYNNLGTYSVKPWAGMHCTSTVMESLYVAGLIGEGLIGKISYNMEIADPEEFYEHFVSSLTHQAGYLLNNRIPKDLNTIPVKNVKPAPLEDVFTIKVR